MKFKSLHTDREFLQGLDQKRNHLFVLYSHVFGIEGCWFDHFGEDLFDLLGAQTRVLLLVAKPKSLCQVVEFINKSIQ